MKLKLFVDTDVVIDFFADREPHVTAASQLFELNERGLVRLYISAVSINNIYYIVRRYLGHKKTIEVIEALVEMTEIIGTTKMEIIEAIRSDFSDFEDSVQHASAMKIEGLDAIITRNTKDYRSSSIAAMTPSGFMKLHEDKFT